jgi:hypothetical protein
MYVNVFNKFHLYQSVISILLWQLHVAATPSTYSSSGSHIVGGGVHSVWIMRGLRFSRCWIEDSGHLGSDAAGLSEWCSAFRRNVLPSFPRCQYLLIMTLNPQKIRTPPKRRKPAKDSASDYIKLVLSRWIWCFESYLSVHLVHNRAMSRSALPIVFFSLWKRKCRLLYLKTQSVLLSKHFLSGVIKTNQFML